MGSCNSSTEITGSFMKSFGSSMQHLASCAESLYSSIEFLGSFLELLYRSVDLLPVLKTVSSKGQKLKKQIIAAEKPFSAGL